MNRKDSRQDSIVQQPQNRKGFSLIETIVVLGITTAALGVVFSYIILTEKSRDIFYYQSAFKDVMHAVDNYKGLYGLASLTQDSLVSSGFLPATWTPVETVGISAWQTDSMVETANEEFLLAVSVASWNSDFRFIRWTPYKHPILLPTGDWRDSPEGNLLRRYCNKLAWRQPTKAREIECRGGSVELMNGDSVYSLSFIVRE